MHLKLPTLKYRQLRGDMIEVFKLMHNVYDLEILLSLKSDTILTVGVIFRPYGWKSCVIIHYFPSVRTEIYS